MPEDGSSSTTKTAGETDHNPDIMTAHGCACAVIGVGASAGGLEAFSGLLSALPSLTGMAFIFVQHLDPTHSSLLSELLAGHTSMAVLEAEDRMPIAPDHVYVIPPGVSLSVEAGMLRVSVPQQRHGARLPFDFLLHSMAKECGRRAICVILSGTGADGSLGLAAIKKQGGLVLVQDPDEAGFDGMPRNAIRTGEVDEVLTLADMKAALMTAGQAMAAQGVAPDARAPAPADAGDQGLAEIIALLHAKTGHDFTLYKPGTLLRRIERRMALAGIDMVEMGRYVALLTQDPSEIEQLAKDLLIHITGFFRDPKVFQYLEQKIIPEMVAAHPLERPLRIWVAGCSTGEETYSLAMLIQEEIARVKAPIKLQIFASDLDPGVVAIAREGCYGADIVADIPPERRARFFTEDHHRYRVDPALRAAIVFTVQDLLADPPFSQIDFISCRNLLIYLQPSAQTKIMALFHFALCPGGILMLGNAESIGDAEGKSFAVISKKARLFRSIGRTAPQEFKFVIEADQAVPKLKLRGVMALSGRPLAYAELCRKLILDSYAPAAVLINTAHECLYFIGPTDHYLKVPAGHPVNDILAIVRDGVRAKLRAAIEQASAETIRVSVTGGRVKGPDGSRYFNIIVQPVQSAGELLLLICFIDEPAPASAMKAGESVADHPRIISLEQELQATRSELHGTIRELEISTQEQRAVNEEALSVNEEFQSTNEELLTSKEELQSLNEELTALNSQLQSSLDHQRLISNDLQNILNSTDVATIFLDTYLNIRLFTPATKLLFNMLPGDVGRPLADLNSLALDQELLSDARSVLQNELVIEREIEAKSGAWYIRRVLPYRKQNSRVDGVVITFSDMTERRHSADALVAAQKQAQLANEAKSRFLAAASHDLRQPLQALTLFQGLLAKAVMGSKAERLVARLDETLTSMRGMLNTLLDINQIEAGVVRADVHEFPINDLLDRLHQEFFYQTDERHIALRVVPSSRVVRSDPVLLEQILRNLLSNALKYTKHGKILLGCRRLGAGVRIEIWDTGIGIPDYELQSIFQEYHQLDNPARESTRGLGLGLSIVERLSKLLGHQVQVRSRVGRGSVFSIAITDTPEPERAARIPDIGLPALAAQPVSPGRQDDKLILVVEDDRDVRELLDTGLREAGFRVASVADGEEAGQWLAGSDNPPDLLLTDFNLPHEMNGLAVARSLRRAAGAGLPVIVLTGDVSARTLHNIAAENCVHLDKPVKLPVLIAALQRTLAMEPRAAPGSLSSVIVIIDDDDVVRGALRSVVEQGGREVEEYGSCEAFLAQFQPGRDMLLLVDEKLPGMSGLQLLQFLGAKRQLPPAIMITGNSDVPMAVAAMKAGATDFIEKPVKGDDLMARIERALDGADDSQKSRRAKAEAALNVASLSPRERQIMDLVLQGQPSKIIAADLGISQRTVEHHRATIMRKTGAKLLPALARLVFASGPNEAG